MSVLAIITIIILALGMIAVMVFASKEVKKRKKIESDIGILNNISKHYYKEIESIKKQITT